MLLKKKERTQFIGLLKQTEKDYGALLGNYGVVKESNVILLGILQNIVKKNDHVLDVGCGSGFMLYALSHLKTGVFYGLEKYLFPSYKDSNFSVDHISHLVVHCRKQNIHLLNVDIETGAFPFKENSFDVLFSKAVIEHFHYSPRNMLKEAYKTLKHGGYFVLSTPNLTRIDNRLRFLRGRSIFQNYDKYYHYDGIFTGHIREHTMEESKYAVQKAGFHIEEAFYGINRPESAGVKDYFIRFMKNRKKDIGDIIFVVARK